MSFEKEILDRDGDSVCKQYQSIQVFLNLLIVGHMSVSVMKNQKVPMDLVSGSMYFVRVLCV